jgi:hypothetical protein
MSANRFFPISVRAVGRVSFLFAFALSANFSVRADVNADGTTTPDPPSDSKAVAGGKDGKSAATTTEQETEYKNWIEVGIGGTWTTGDRAQFEQQHWTPGDEVFGGITDMHYEHGVGEKATLSIDGHALWDINDYDIRVDLSEPNVGYIRGGYTAFRTWYDGNGGFSPPGGGAWFAPPFPEMHIDRGDVWLELGLRVPNWPEITIHWSHMYRDGQKDSTVWGDTTLTGIVNNGARKIAPAYRDMDEKRDILAVDATKTFGNTDVGIGMRWDHYSNDNKLQLERGAGQLPPAVPAPGQQRFITQNDQNDVDDFTGHVLSETRIKDNLWFTSAYSYSSMGADLSGSRILGESYNPIFVTTFPQLQSNDHAIINLAGVSSSHEHVFNSNLFWIPFKDLEALVGFRYTHESIDTSSTFLDANTATSPPPTHYTPAIPKSADSSENTDEIAERFELRYKHIQDWLFYAEAELEQAWGDVREHEFGGALVGGVPTGFDQGAMTKDTHFFDQKYTAGATWYPMARLNLAAQYYYKEADYDNDFHSELATPTDVPTPLGAERNQRLLGQDWTTNDANIRITVRPKMPTNLGTLSLVTRYDFMQSEVSGKWGVAPAGPPPVVPPAPPAIPTGTILNEEMTGLITNHVISESATWNPCARFYIQAVGSYVLNQTETPASKINLIPYSSPTVVDFRNDFWTVTGAAGYVLDELTDLRADYTFYCANDHFKNSRVALPYGLGATEHTVSAIASRQITKQIRVTLQYRFFDYQDELYGGHNNYTAHSLFSGLQYRF